MLDVMYLIEPSRLMLAGLFDSKRAPTVVSFHCLRATAVTMLHDAGIPAATVEEWVGHDSAEVHKAYVKIGRESLQKASAALPEL